MHHSPVSLDDEMGVYARGRRCDALSFRQGGIEEGAGLDFREDHKADGGRSKAGRQSGAMP